MSSGTQRGVVAIQYDRKPFGLKGGADFVHPRGVERRERLAAPQVERLVEQRCRFERVGCRAGLGGHVPEEVQVDRQGVGRQHVATRLADNPHVSRAGQQAAQSGQVTRQSVAGPMRRLVCPHPIDQLIHRDRSVYVDQQGDEDTPLARVTGLETLAVESSLDVAE